MLLYFIIICGIAFSLVKWTAARAWHVFAAMVAGFLLSMTKVAPDIHQVIHEISGGHL